MGTRCAESTPHALAALFEASSKGEYNFLDEVRVYSQRAAKLKIIFQENGFDLVYDEDMGEPIGDGFYFTVSRQSMKGDELLFEMLRHGMAGIPLSITGSTKEGIRICVSFIEETQFKELAERLSVLDHHLHPSCLWPVYR